MMALPIRDIWNDGHLVLAPGPLRGDVEILHAREDVGYANREVHISA